MSYDEKEKYLNGVKRHFVFSSLTEDWANKETNRQNREKWLVHIKLAFVFLSTFFGSTWLIGWVVRGFLGVPMGFDRRQEM